MCVFARFFFLCNCIGLCTDSINQTARDMPPPTAGDLQGFWEMVYLQVENVESLFADLEKLRANDWKVISKETNSLIHFE